MKSDRDAEPSAEPLPPETAASAANEKTLQTRRRFLRQAEEVEAVLNALASDCPRDALQPPSVDEWDPCKGPPIDWQTVPAACDPAGIIVDARVIAHGDKAIAAQDKLAARARRKQQQVQSFAIVLRAMLTDRDSPAAAATRLHIVDFGCGTGNLLLPLAAAFPSCAFTGVDMKPAALALLQRRATSAQLANVTAWCGMIEAFPQPFDVALALHACGNATDVALQLAVACRAAFIASPCCVGKLAFSMRGGSSFHSSHRVYAPALAGGGQPSEDKEPQAQAAPAAGAAAPGAGTAELVAAAAGPAGGGAGGANGATPDADGDANAHGCGSTAQAPVLMTQQADAAAGVEGCGGSTANASATATATSTTAATTSGTTPTPTTSATAAATPSGRGSFSSSVTAGARTAAISRIITADASAVTTTTTPTTPTTATSTTGTPTSVTTTTTTTTSGTTTSSSSSSSLAARVTQVRHPRSRWLRSRLEDHQRLFKLLARTADTCHTQAEVAGLGRAAAARAQLAQRAKVLVELDRCAAAAEEGGYTTALLKVVDARDTAKNDLLAGLPPPLLQQAPGLQQGLGLQQAPGLTPGLAVLQEQPYRVGGVTGSLSEGDGVPADRWAFCRSKLAQLHQGLQQLAAGHVSATCLQPTLNMPPATLT